MPNPRPFASGPPLLRRSELRWLSRSHWSAPSPWAEDEVRGPEHLAGALRRAHMRGRRLRGGAGASLGEPASQGLRARRTGQPRAFAHSDRDAVLVEVERLPRGKRRREPRVLWLWWHGSGEPDLGLLWRSYVRRFDSEHTFRFLKQTLGWITSRVRHPEQADRWTWLVVGAFTKLRLARACVADRRLPWERRYDPGRLTPIRVHRVVLTLLAELGTPARPPKPCGRSPGRPQGRLSGRAKRYPAVKKAG